MIFDDINQKCEGYFQATDTERALISATANGVIKWFTAMHSEGKLVTGSTITEKSNSFYDEIKITGKFIFSEGCNKKSPVRTQVTTGTV